MEDVLLVVWRAETESRAGGRPVPQRAVPVEPGLPERPAVDPEEGGPHEAEEGEARRDRRAPVGDQQAAAELRLHPVRQ